MQCVQCGSSSLERDASLTSFVACWNPEKRLWVIQAAPQTKSYKLGKDIRCRDCGVQYRLSTDANNLQYEEPGS